MELKDATVLIVDDERMLLDIFSEWLTEENSRVLTAGDGATALRILRNDRVDLIVSDVRTPVMDGILLLKNLTTYSGLFQGNHPPKMIFISGFTGLEPREAYHMGVEAILQKPIERTEFVGTVRRTLRSPEETWSKPLIPGGMPLHVVLPRVSPAIEQGRIAFGRGGFCLYSSSHVRESAVRFDLEFESDQASFAGYGLIRWAEPEEHLLGVEISNIDESCREWALGVIAANAESSYIPRVPSSATPRSKVAK